MTAPGCFCCRVVRCASFAASSFSSAPTLSYTHSTSSCICKMWSTTERMRVLKSLPGQTSAKYLGSLEGCGHSYKRCCFCMAVPIHMHHFRNAIDWCEDMTSTVAELDEPAARLSPHAPWIAPPPCLEGWTLLLSAHWPLLSSSPDTCTASHVLRTRYRTNMLARCTQGSCTGYRFVWELGRSRSKRMGLQTSML